VHARVREAIERVLGASIVTDDERSGFIEAAFGLVNSERLRCTLEALDAERTAIHIEAFYAAGTDVPETSRNVEALAEALTVPE
jgi:hypothetical protein